MGKIVYRHDRVTHGAQRHRLTAAIDRDARAVGISVTSSKDQFRRKIGNEIAKSRLDVCHPNDIMIVLPAIKGRKSGLTRWQIADFLFSVIEEVSK